MSSCPHWGDRQWRRRVGTSVHSIAIRLFALFRGATVMSLSNPFRFNALGGGFLRAAHLLQGAGQLLVGQSVVRLHSVGLLRSDGLAEGIHRFVDAALTGQHDAVIE